MQNQRQGVRSTKVISQQKTQLISEAKFRPEEKRNDVFLTVYKPKEKIYTEQIGKFPYRSIRGNKYQMIIYKIYGNSICIEPIKKKIEG